MSGVPLAPRAAFYYRGLHIGQGPKLSEQRFAIAQPVYHSRLLKLPTHTTGMKARVAWICRGTRTPQRECAMAIGKPLGVRVAGRPWHTASTPPLGLTMALLITTVACSCGNQWCVYARQDMELSGASRTAPILMLCYHAACCPQECFGKSLCEVRLRY